jgi:hypothetical protein
MFTFTRMVRFKNVASMIAAMPICVEIVKYNEKITKMESHLMVPTLGGHPSRVLFVFRGDDIAKMQAAADRITQDKKYIEMVKKLGEFVDGTATNDQAWKMVV